MKHSSYIFIADFQALTIPSRYVDRPDHDDLKAMLYAYYVKFGHNKRMQYEYDQKNYKLMKG